MAKRDSDRGEPVVIKKYANRRLYNTDSSSYVTLDDLCQMVKNGVDFVVYDAKSGEDITRSVLTQIIFEQETKGENLLPIGFLRELIGYYDDHLRALVPSYLEVAMDNFSRNQNQIRKNLEDTFGELFPFQKMQELGQQNMAMFREALSMFGQFDATDGAAAETDEGGDETKRQSRREPAPELRELREQLERMQKQIDSLSGRK